MTWPALLLATTMVASAVTPCVADPTPVFGCGVSIRGRNVLTADMDCSSLNGPAILMENGASLDLGGFTVTANTIGIRCLEGKCKIEGPGTIRRFEFDPGGDTFNNHGIQAYVRARIRNVTVENWVRGVFGLGPTDLRGVTATNCVYGAMGGPLKVVDSTFTNIQQAAVYAYEGTKDGVHYTFYPLKVRRCQFSGNLIDVAAYRHPAVGDSNCTTSYLLTVPFRPYGGGDEWNVCP